MLSKRDLDIAQLLGREGQAFSVTLANENRTFFNSLPNSYYAVASAIALCWTKHAQFDGTFIEYASGYIDGTLPRDPNMAATYSFRFGVESLDSALSNYRSYFARVRNFMPADFNTCSVQDINRLQQRLLNELNSLRSQRLITGIGPWLFLGPFKIILGDQQRLWDNDGINAIILPTGIEVNRGINRLVAERYGFMEDFDVHWLEENTGSLLDGYATCAMAHNFMSSIASLAKTSILQINSGLWKYGKQEI